jgi:hypothetical protein
MWLALSHIRATPVLAGSWQIGASIFLSMNQPNDDLRLMEHSLLYQMFARQRDEILRYKWIESEKAGVDIGFDKALLGWLIKHSAVWQEQRQPGGCLFFLRWQRCQEEVP